MFELVLWDDEGKGCTFYSCLEVDDESEMNLTDRFYRRFLDDPSFSEDLNTIDEVIDIISTKGALDIYFRPEGPVEAIPPKPHNLQKLGLTDLVTMTGLRLYALRLSTRVVVLFDGEQKTTAKNQDKGSKVSMKWHEAKSKAARIIEACREGQLVENKGYLEDESGKRDHLLV